MVVYYAAGAGLAVILLVVLVTRSKSQSVPSLLSPCSAACLLRSLNCADITNLT